MSAPSFTLAITEADKLYMTRLVRSVIEQALDGIALETMRLPAPQGELPQAELGAFVTLKRQGRLRGCIGMVQAAGPLYATLANMALAAAFRDPRFPPLEADEYAGLSLEISIMGPVSPCPGPEGIVIGRHGLILRKDGRSGLLLPQVPVEWNWDVPVFLQQLCVKAGLPAGAWNSPGAELLWFEAEHFDLPTLP